MSTTNRAVTTSLFDWHEYHVLADRLRVAGSEADLRSSISRAYYSCFHFARLWLIKRHVVMPREKVHHFVWDTIKTLGHKQGFKAGEIGFALRDLRNDADYHSPLYVKWDVRAADVLQKADDVRGLLKAIP